MKTDRQDHTGIQLCRFAGHSCGACCWGSALSQSSLTRALRRRRRYLDRLLVGPALPSRWRLLWYEQRLRRGADLLLGLLLYVPWIRTWLGRCLYRRLVCAFVAFEDNSEQRVGCRLHPGLWNGEDIRCGQAFFLLRGFVCGGMEFACPAATAFELASEKERASFAASVRNCNWYAYSQAAPSFGTGESADEGAA